MDIDLIVSNAVKVLSSYLSALATGRRTDGNEQAGQLWQFVSQGLRGSRTGTRMIGELERAPSDPRVLDLVKDAIEDEARRDARFAAGLERLLSQEWQTDQGNLGPGASAAGNINVSGGQIDNRGAVLATGGASVDQSRRTRIGVGAIVAILILGGSVAGIVLFGGGNSNTNTGTAGNAGAAGGQTGVRGKWTAFPDVCGLNIQQIEFYADGATLALNAGGGNSGPQGAWPYSYIDASHIKYADQVLGVTRAGDALTLTGGTGTSCVLHPPGTTQSDLFGTWSFPDTCQAVSAESGGSLDHWDQGDQWTFTNDGTMSMTRGGQPSSSQYHLTDAADVVIDDEDNLLTLDIGTTVNGGKLNLDSVQILSGPEQGVQMSWVGACTLDGTG